MLTPLKENNSGKFAENFSERKIINATLSVLGIGGNVCANSCHYYRGCLVCASSNLKVLGEFVINHYNLFNTYWLSFSHGQSQLTCCSSLHHWKATNT